MGQKGRTCHRWYERGVRPPGPADKRFASLYLFAACRPGTDEAFALALPEATTASMAVFLERFARELGPDVHAALILDRAGWHVARRLAVPASVTLWSRCRPTRRSSTRSSGSGSTCASASSPIACSPTTRPCSMPPATPGMRWPARPAGSPASPPTPTCSGQNFRELVSWP